MTTPARETYQCQQCRHTAEFTTDEDGVTPESAARVAGWRLYRGDSVAGTGLSIVLCPAHSGAGTPEQIAPLIRWDAECDTCHDVLSEIRDAHDEVTESDARHWAATHQCEPDTHVIKPPTEQTQPLPTPSPTLAAP